MIPGLTSKISEELIVAAATIRPKKDLIFVSGTTAIATIIPPYSGFSGILFIVATDAAGVATVTSGNIQVVVTMTTSKVNVFVFSKINQKWYPGAIS